MGRTIRANNQYTIIHNDLILGRVAPPLTPTELTILCILAASPGIDPTTTTITNASPTIDPTTITPTIQNLTNRGLIHYANNTITINTTTPPEPTPEPEPSSTPDNPTTIDTARTIITHHLPTPLIKTFRAAPADATKLLTAVVNALNAGVPQTLITSSLAEPLGQVRSPIAVLLTRLDPTNLQRAQTALNALNTTTPRTNQRIPQCGQCTGGAYALRRPINPEVRRTTNGDPCPNCHPETQTENAQETPT